MKKIGILLMVFVLAGLAILPGCSRFGGWITEDDPDKQVELEMWVPMPGGLEPNDLDKITQLVNEQLETKLPNTTVVFKFEDSNSFGSVMTRKFGAEEEFDICFTSMSSNSYFENATKENFYPITPELLETYCPTAKATIPQSLWDMIEVGGNYYAIINNQSRPRQFGVSADTMMLRKYVAQKLGRDNYTDVSMEEFETYIAENITEMSDLTDYMAFARENVAAGTKFITSMYDMSNLIQYMGLDDFGSYNVPGAIPWDATSADEIVNQFETEEFKQLIQLASEWYGADKYIDPSVMSGGLTSSVFSTLSMRFLGSYKPGVEADEYTLTKKDMTAIPMGEAILSSSGCLSTMNAISYTSKNPIRALKFLDLLYRDAELFNLITLGREGTEYRVISRNEDDTPAQVELLSSAKYRISSSWVYGNQFLAYPTDKQDVDVWEQTETYNSEAKVSVAYGFIFDEEPVKSEIANCSRVYDNNFMQLLNNTNPYVDSGAGKDKQFYDAFIAEMKAQGADRIIEELKRQFTEFLNSK